MHPVVGCVAVVVLLVGCTAQAEPRVGSSDGGDVRSQPSKQELLLLSATTFAEYADVVEGIHTGEILDTAALRPLVTEARYEAELELFGSLKELGWSASGRSTQSKLTLADVGWEGDSLTWVVHLCSNARELHYYDSVGTEMRPAGRAEVTALEVEFLRSGQKDLRIDEVAEWDASYCDEV
jgi:hypothetical protein